MAVSRRCQPHISLMQTQLRSVQFVVQATAQSKANSRQIVKTKRGPMVIKSKKALDFVTAIREQMPAVCDLIELPCVATISIYYPSRRQDLDESALLDAMQFKNGVGVMVNDRLVREKHIYWGLDDANPRCEVHLLEKPEIDPEFSRKILKARAKKLPI